MKLKGLTLKALSYGDRIRSVRDWLFVLMGALVLFIGSIAWNAWFYVVVTGEKEFEAGTTTASTPSLEALPHAREVLNARAAEEARYRTFYEFVDPSP